MKKKNKRYSTSFKEKAVELAYARGSVKEVCEELDIPLSVLGRWKREQQVYGTNSFPGHGKPKLTDEEKEIVSLKKQLKDMQLERDILKKAISIFSESDRKNLGS